MIDLPPIRRSDYEEAKAASEKAQEEINKADEAWNKDHPFGEKNYPPYEVYRVYMKPYYDKARKIRCAMVSLIDDYTLEDYDTIGDYMSLEEFKDGVECTGFTDYDGFGYLCIGDKQTNITIHPSDLKNGVDLSKFDGVMWYNK